MCKKLFFAAAIISLLSSGDAVAGSREQAIRAASRLSEVSYGMYRFAARQGYPRTSYYLRGIAQTADKVEEAARFSTRKEAARYTNRLIRLYISMRPYMNNIPDPWARRFIQLNVRNSINALGVAVFDNFTTVRMLRYSSAVQPEAVDRQLDEIQEGTASSEEWSEGGEAVTTAERGYATIEGHEFEVPEEEGFTIEDDDVINPVEVDEQEWSAPPQ